MGMADLPEDMIVEILHRVPQKPLVRFSLVSKRWHSIICDDPQFKKSYVKLASEKQTLSRRLLLCTGAAHSQVESLDLETPSFGVTKVGCPFNNRGYRVKLLGSCNGLVCVALVEPEQNLDGRYAAALESIRNLYIWNPSNGFFQKLHDPGFSGEDGIVVYSGFGHLSATDDYKVFVATGRSKWRPVGNWWDIKKVKIFSLRSKLWKMIELPPDISLRRRRGTLCNEALHWILNPSYSRGIDHIVAFDLAKEEFSRQIPLPDSLMKVRGAFKELGQGVYSAGCLCVMSSSRKDSIDLWVMTEYGVRDSWTKLFNFMIANPLRDTYECNERPISIVTEEGTLFVVIHGAVTWNNRLLLKIDHKQGTLGQYKLPKGYAIDYIIQHEEMEHEDSPLWI